MPVHAVHADLGREDFRIALAAEKDDAFVKDAQPFHLHRPGTRAVGIQGNTVEEAHIHREKSPVEHHRFHVDVGVEQFRTAALDGHGPIQDLLAADGGIEPQVFNTVLVFTGIIDFFGMDANGLAVLPAGVDELMQTLYGYFSTKSSIFRINTRTCPSRLTEI